MRLCTTLAATAAAAAFAVNFWQISGKTAGSIVVVDMQPAVAEPEDDLTLMLRQEARTAVLELQQRQAQF